MKDYVGLAATDCFPKTSRVTYVDDHWCVAGLRGIDQPVDPDHFPPITQKAVLENPAKEAVRTGDESPHFLWRIAEGLMAKHTSRLSLPSPGYSGRRSTRLFVRPACSVAHLGLSRVS